MSEDRIANHRHSNQVANMSEDRHNHKLQSDQLENMPEERRNNVIFKSTDQIWDLNNPCEHCGCVFLKSESTNFRKLCCQNGSWKVEESGYPLLNPLPDVIKELCINETEHFSEMSNLYNNLLSFAITGVDNGREGVGYEVFNMKSCVKLNGRIYHQFPIIQGREQNGITNFIHDVRYHVDTIFNQITDFYLILKIHSLYKYDSFIFQLFYDYIKSLLYLYVI